MKKIYLISMFVIIGSICLKAQISQSTLKNVNDEIENVLAEINADSVEAHMQWLQDMGTRFMMAQNRREVSVQIKNKFHSFGIADVVLDSFQCNTFINYENLHYDTTTWQYNVIATLAGTNYPDEISIICGHHDAVIVAPGAQPETFAPGADDNASGTASVLESARAIMAAGHQPEASIRFITFAAEELMGFGDAGSEYYAPMAAANGDDIKMVINNDMIAYDGGNWTIGISNVIGSEDVTAIATNIASNYTTLNIDLWPPTSNGGADLKAFNEVGYKGVFLMEHIFNPNYHTEADLVENCNIAYCTEVIKIACGSLIYRDISLGQQELSAKTCIDVYPNPAQNVVFVRNPGGNKCHLVLRDLSGRIIMDVDFTKAVYQAEISSFVPGVYMLSLISEGKNYSGKLMVAK